jgi:hypothetical protein
MRVNFNMYIHIYINIYTQIIVASIIPRIKFLLFFYLSKKQKIRKSKIPLDTSKGKKKMYMDSSSV